MGLGLVDLDFTKLVSISKMVEIWRRKRRIVEESNSVLSMGRRYGGGFRKESLSIDCQVLRLSFLVLGMSQMSEGRFLLKVWVWAFVYDDWVGVGPSRLLFPRLFRIVSNKESSVKECFVWNGNMVSWNISVKRALRHQSW